MLKLKKKGLLLSCAVGLAFALALTALLCLALAALIHRQALPEGWGGGCAAAAAGGAVFLATLTVAGLRGRQALPTGGCISAGLILTAVVACAVSGGSFGDVPWLPRLMLAALGGGLLGAVMSLRSGRRNKRRK